MRRSVTKDDFSDASCALWEFRDVVVVEVVVVPRLSEVERVFRALRAERRGGSALVGVGAVSMSMDSFVMLEVFMGVGAEIISSI